MVTATQAYTGLTPEQLRSGGVLPVGFIEPLNDWQKAGLSAMAAGTAYTDPSAYLNPFLEQVLGRTTARLNDQAEEVRKRLMASQGFRKAFGDSSLGVQMSEIDRSLMNAVGDATANLAYTGFNDAVGRGRQHVSDIIGAGTAIQQQNQRPLDVLRDEIYGVQNYDRSQVEWLGKALGMFPGSQVNNQFSQSPNSAARTANIMNTIGGINWDSVFGGGRGDAYDDAIDDELWPF